MDFIRFLFGCNVKIFTIFIHCWDCLCVMNGLHGAGIGWQAVGVKMTYQNESVVSCLGQKFASYTILVVSSTTFQLFR